MRSPSPKTIENIRTTGAVYTPPKVAAAIVESLGGLGLPSGLKILEPSVGDGAFLREMRQRWVGDHYTLVDIDETVIRRLRRKEKSEGAGNVSLRAMDFLSLAASLIRDGRETFDVIIGNPPFIRSRNFTAKLKTSMAAVAQAMDYPRPQLKNTWAAFLASGARLLSPQGVMAFVLPYELITVAYGQEALRRLVPQFRRIDIYVSREKAFPEIDQDAIVLIAQRGGDAEPGVYMNRVATLSDLTSGESQRLDLSQGADSAVELNAYLLEADTVSLLRRLRRSCDRLDVYTGSAPGVVSAANEFFILRKDEVARLGFADWVLPILKKGSLASHKPEFTASDFEALASRDPVYLLRIRGEREDLPPDLIAYLEFGEKQGFDQRYKCRNRSRWYEVPIVPKETAFVFKRAHSYPRLCLNEADVYLTDTAYGLRIKEGYSARGLTFSFYTTLTMAFAEMDGRFYGGGVLELSPNEFRGLPIVYHEPSDAEYEAFLKVHEDAQGDPGPILDFGDRWLAPRLSLSPDGMKKLRSAWLALRAHRLRHSGRPQDVTSSDEAGPVLDSTGGRRAHG